jgi:hypothetical protein
MGNYAPFTTNPTEPIFNLNITEAEEPLSYTEELRQEDEGQVIVCGSYTTDAEGQPSRSQVFEFIWQQKTTGWLITGNGYRQARLLIASERERKPAIDNALMIQYTLATADKNTVLFHAAVVSHENKAYMFLGVSGTGKSTHARLWLEHIEGTALVNDDNPIVRFTPSGSALTYAEGTYRVYGSPWSGKTPCYRDVSYPLGGIVLLSQAPYNRIQRMSSLQAYAALLSSISGKRWDEQIANGLHSTENQMISHIPMWHLECLPDEAAAQLCRTTVEHHGE